MSKKLNSFEDVEAEARRIYEIACKLDPDDALRMALAADDTEEKRFYTYIATMNLDRRHKVEFQEYVSRKDDEEAEQRNSERREEKSRENEGLYEKAFVLEPAYLIRLACKAETKEEQRFYIYISDMNLQRAQKEVIRKNLF